jgi:glycosyltransferase involved in cell wall biosynthesis
VTESQVGKPLQVIFLLAGVVKSGGLRVIGELANGLAARGHQVALLQPGNQPFPFPLLDRVARLCIDIGPARAGGRVGRRMKEAKALLLSIPRNADIVVSTYHLTAYVAAVAQKIYGMHHVYLVQGYEPDFFPPTFFGRAQRMAATLSYKLPGRMITVSTWLRDRVAAHKSRCIPVISDGVDLGIFRRPNGGRQDNLVMTMGWQEERKGLADFIAAIEQVWLRRQDLSVMIVSSDPQLRVCTHVPHHIFHPDTDRTMACFYQRATMFVSASHLEGFGLPVLEAMACGTPVITTRNGGVSDFVADEVNALMVPVAARSELAAAIERLLEDRALRLRLSEAATATAVHYSWDRMIDAFESELLNLTA